MPEILDQNLTAMYRKLARVAGSMEALQRTGDADAGAYSYTYVTLNTVLASLKAALAEEGLTLLQPIRTDGEIMMVETTIIDDDTGYALTFPGPGHKVQANPQAVGSAITYFRRYSLMSLFGLAAEDDDGGEAQRQATRPTQRTEAETLIRGIRDDMSAEDRNSFDADFRQNFGSNLSSLPESRHGEALTWTHWWVGNADEDETPSEAPT